MTPADDDLRRDGVGLDADDSTWSEVVVPHHWRTTAGFEDATGPMLYRRAFRLDPPADGRRRWVTFDGVFYQADVWLDGAYLGDPEGYFVPSSYDITALSRLGDHHVLAVEVACPDESGHRGRRNVTGVFQHWDGLDRTWNPGGLSAPVRVHDTGPVRIDRFRVGVRDADERRAHVLLHARLDSDAGRRVVVRTGLEGEHVDEQEHDLASGANEVAWSVDVVDPELWWPRGLGDQHLTEITVEVLVDDEPSDVTSRRTGLRQVSWKNWVCSINGETLFLKGANLLPTRPGLADATVDEIRRDVQLAVDAGLDVVRVHGHLGRRELYEACDEAGLLVMQDFPLQWHYARSVRDAARDQARAAVDVYGHHPSIVSWSAHNDPAGVAVGLTGDGPRNRLRYTLAQQLPGWNRSVLDRWVKRAFERADPTRPCSAHSGVLPHVPQLDGTDSHFYFGWFHGDLDDLAPTARRLPRLFRFLSEFGAQSVPDHADFVDTSRWPELDREHLEVHHAMQGWVFDERIPPSEFETFDAWRDATQDHQAELVRHHVETLRRLKYRPAGGFAVFALNDPQPLVSWGLVDHLGTPKRAYHALRAACAPVIVVMDRPPEMVVPGERLRADVHVVNDRRSDVDGAVVTVRARWAGGERTWRFAGDAPADDCVHVGRVELRVPDTMGSLRFELTLEAPPDVEVANHYSTAVTVLPD